MAVISEYETEVIRGLPGNLPQGERILWQGAPDTASLAVHAFHIRAIAVYFTLITAWSGIQAVRGLGSWTGAAVTLGIALIGTAIVASIAWASARSTVYTLTDRRLVLRFGIALPKCVNLPLALLTSADLRVLPNGHGDLALTIGAEQRLGWLQLWPHVRPWAISEVKPMLRSIPEAEKFAGLLARTAGTVQGTPVASAPRLAVAA